MLKIISLIISIFFALISSIITFFLLKTGILPQKYLILIVISLFVLSFVFIFLSLKKSKRNILKILSLIFSTVFSVALIFIISFSINILRNQLEKSKYQTETFLVITKNTENFSTLDSLKDKKIAIYKSPSDTYDSALIQLSDKLSFEKSNYPDYYEATCALLSGETDALFLSNALYNIATESVADFNENNVKKLHEIKIQTDLTATLDENSDITKDSFSVFISGIDTYGEISEVSRSDVNMIMTVSPKTHKILLTSIPRDYYVLLHGTEGPYDKLTHAGIYGVDMSVKTIEDLFNTKISYYIRVNFTTLVNFVDTIGGVDIVPDTTFKLGSCNFVENESVHLNGKCALSYARERHTYETGDRHRVLNQQDVLAAIIKKSSTEKNLIKDYKSLLDVLNSSYQTNIPLSKIYKFINMQIDSMPSWSIEKYSVDGWGSMDITYSGGSQPLYVMIPDEATVKAATEKINAVLNDTNLVNNS